MHKIIHPTFELDLTSYAISVVDENYWFSDQLFTKFSFPFTFELTEDLIEVFGELLDDNAKFIETSFNVQYAIGNQLENSVFEIESQIGKQVTSTFRYGFDELPNYNKKLSELPLEETVIADVYTHAKSIIPLTWPTVNYNYPQIYTDKYDTTEKTWESFAGKINNYVAGDFLENTFTDENFANKNIIQPIPYVLHILTQGFLDAGFTLKGDILTNPILLKMLLFTDIDYFDLRGNIQDYIMFRSEITSTAGEVAYYADTLELQPDSTYKITGKLNSYSKSSSNGYTLSYSRIEYKGTAITGTGGISNLENESEIDVTFMTDSDTDSATQILTFNASGYKDFIQSHQTLYDIKIERVLEDSPSEVRLYDKVKLTEVVPDVTFGKLISEIRKWFNFEVNPVGNDIYMNFIENQINYNEATDLSNSEVLKPKREFYKLDSLLLKFKEPDNVQFSYESIYQNKEIILKNESLVNDNTEKIEIDILPLPQKSYFFVETANSFDLGGNTKMYGILYNGLVNNLNLTQDPAPMLIPAIHENYHKNWFIFRLLAIIYTWAFKMYAEELLKIKKKVFAYGRYHVVKTIDKTQISEDLFDVEIETETLP
jgi:hypothetical protein